MAPKKYSSREAAAYLGVAEQTLRLYRSDPDRCKGFDPPAYYKHGHWVWYLKDDLDACKAANPRFGVPTEPVRIEPKHRRKA